MAGKTNKPVKISMWPEQLGEEHIDMLNQLARASLSNLGGNFSRLQQTIPVNLDKAFGNKVVHIHWTEFVYKLAVMYMDDYNLMDIIHTWTSDTDGTTGIKNLINILYERVFDTKKDE